MHHKSFHGKEIVTKELVIASLIIVMPFLFFLYELIPEEGVWKIWNFEYEFDYFEDANYFMWIFSVRMLTIMIIGLWYITCRHWWKFILILPLLIEFYKLYGFLNDEFHFFEFINNIDTFIKVLPLTIPSIFIFIIISNLIGFNKKEDILDTEITKEITEQLHQVLSTDIKKYKEIKKRLKHIKAIRNSLSNENYLKELYYLRLKIFNNNNDCI